jgi:hypothetical protein
MPRSRKPRNFPPSKIAQWKDASSREIDRASVAVIDDNDPIADAAARDAHAGEGSSAPKL